MKESTPIFDNSTPRPPGKLAFGRDINRAVADALSGIRGALPPEELPDGDRAPTSRYLCKIIQPEAGSAKYKCAFFLDVRPDLLNPSAALSSAATLNDDDALGDYGVFANITEMDSGTHGLQAGDVLHGWLVGYTDDDRPVLIGAASGALPTPQYQFMVMQAGTQNQLTADWTRAHDLI